MKKARLVSLVLALVLLVSMSSAAVAGSFTEPTSPVTLNMWLFAETHGVYFRWATEEYTKLHPNVNFNVEVMQNDALQDRLSVVFNAGGEGSPDLVDIEQGTFPRYMSDSMMHFVPLNDYMTRDGQDGRMVEARLSLYNYKGNNYGLEHALCPVTMAYRPDMFEKLGIAPPTTWQEYKDAAYKLKDEGIYIAQMGDFHTGVPGDLSIWLRAANADIVGADGNLQLTDEWKTVLADLVQMQKDGCIFAAETSEDGWLQVRENRVATIIMADWAAGWLRDNVPEQSGQWKVTYLPKLNDTASRASVYGGTGLCMVEYTPNDRELVWDFMKFAMLDTDNCVKKYEVVSLYPPVYDAMERSNTPVEYYGGQNLGELWQELAPETPVQRQAAWRKYYGEVCTALMYDFVEGNMTIDELAQQIQDGVAERIANED